MDQCAELLAPGERRSVRYRFRWPVGSEGTSDASRVRVLAGPGFSRCNAWAGADIPAPGLRACVTGRKSLARLHLRRQCATFCGPKKMDRDRSGVLTRTDLSLSIPRSRFLDPSAWRASGRGARCAPPIPPFRPGRPCLAAPAVEPFGPSSPVRVCRDSPSFACCLRVPAPACAFAFNPPARVAERSAPSFRHGRLLGLRLRTDHFAARRRGDSLPCLRRPGAPGGTSSLDWSGLTTKPPKRLPMKHFSCRPAFRCCRATSDRSLP